MEWGKCMLTFPLDWLDSLFMMRDSFLVINKNSDAARSVVGSIGSLAGAIGSVAFK
jgi:hypothetical protein